MISSVGSEHYLDRVGVTGSNPVSPTKKYTLIINALQIHKVFPNVRFELVKFTVYYFLFLKAFPKEEAIRPVGTATKPIPMKIIIVENILPPAVIGYTSP